MKYLLLTILTFPIGCSSTPQEVLTSENAKADAIKLLSELKIDYKGIHCGQPARFIVNYMIVNYSKRKLFELSLG